MLAILGSLPLHINFKSIFQSQQNNWLGFWLDCIVSIGQVEKNWHLDNTESSYPWRIFPFILFFSNFVLQSFLHIHLIHILFVSMHIQSLTYVWLFATPWTVANQTCLSIGLSRQEYWSGLPFLSPGDLPDPGIKPLSPVSPSLADGFFWATWEVYFVWVISKNFIFIC